MSSVKMIRVLSLCLSIIISSIYLVVPSLPIGTLVATYGGLVPIEKLKLGDKVLSYDLNLPNPEDAIIEVAITNIEKHFADFVFDVGIIRALCLEFNKYCGRVEFLL